MIDVVFVLLPHSLILDWAGPAEAFRIANQLLTHHGKAGQFRLRFVGPDAQTCSSVGAMVSCIEPLPAPLANPTWLVLVGMPGSRVDAEARAARHAVQWLRHLRPGHGGLRLITICAGAVLAAHAGLLRGLSVTTHHQHLDELRRVDPSCHVVTNRVFVQDDAGAVWSSAGITTGIDLAIHLIAQECDAALAAQVAQTMVMPLRRGPNDPGLSPFLQGRAHMHPGVHRVQDAVGSAPLTEWTVTRMAEVACTSTRHLARLFDDHVGQAPLAYLRSIRLALAQQALGAGQSVSQAAETAGFSSDTQLRRAWHAAGKAGTPSTAAFANT